MDLYAKAYTILRKCDQYLIKFNILFSFFTFYYYLCLVIALIEEYGI